MTDKLRDRIAAAIDQKYNDEAVGHTYEVCVQAADAVIHELGLTYERSEWPFDGKHRYVTEWECSRCGESDHLRDC